VILIHQRHRQTDRRTDGQHAISIPRYALVHRAVKMTTVHVWCSPDDRYDVWPFMLCVHPLGIWDPLIWHWLKSRKGNVYIGY